MLSTPNRVQFGGEFHLKIPFHYREFILTELEDLLRRRFTQVSLLGLWGQRIQTLHEVDRQSILKLVRLDLLKIRRFIPPKFYELVYPFMWKKSRKLTYEKYKDLIDSITTKDFFTLNP